MLSFMAPWARLYLAHNKSYNLINTLLTLTATCGMAPWARLYLAHNKSYNLINTLLTLTASIYVIQILIFR